MIKELFKDRREIENLSITIQEFLDNPNTLTKLNNVSRTFELDAEEEKKLQEIILKLAKGEIGLYDMTPAIADDLAIEFGRAMDINDKLYEELFMVLEEELNARHAVYQASIPAEIPVVTERDIEKIQKEKSEYAELIEKVIQKFNFSFDEAAKKKFFEIAATFLSNIRTKSQFKNTLTKEAAAGGLGMEHQLADDAAEFLASYSRIKELEKTNSKKQESKKAKSAELADNKTIKQENNKTIKQESEVRCISGQESGGVGERAPSPLVSVSPAPPSISKPQIAIQPASLPETEKPKNEKVPESRPVSSIVGFEAEAKEAQKLKEKVEKLEVLSPAAPLRIDEILKEINLTFPSEELQTRLKMIISSRLKNVRTATQTFETLSLDVSKGGLGLAKAEADKVSLILNKYLGAAGKDLYQSKVAEIKTAEEEEKKRQEERAEREREEQKKVLDERFVKLTGKLLGQESKKAKSAVLADKKTIKQESREAEKGAPSPLVPAPPPVTSAIPSVPSVIPAEAGIQKFPPAPILEKEESVKKPSKILSVIRQLTQKKSKDLISEKIKLKPKEKKAVAPLPPVKPTLQDITFAPQLVGPLEEIGQLTLEDFRKLSSDPREAILKIKDKLTLLREESFKKYQAGISAWQKSPFYAKFLEVLDKSLESGKPVDEQLLGGQTLTPAEFDAIINSRIGD